MKNVTLKQFKYFEALASEGHFGRAADACAISQPALSMQIKELEETLDCELFERSSKHIRLTTFGEVFALKVREILRSVDELSEMARASQSGFISRLRLGIIPTIAPYLLPKLIGNLTYHYPEMDIQVRETLTEKLIEELEQGKLDAAILALPISISALTETSLFDEEFVLVRHREDGSKPVPDVERLSEMQLLLLEEGHCFRDQALSFCNIRSGLPKEGLDGSSLSTLVQMVGAGIGVTLIPEMAISVETRSADVSIARFDKLKPKRKIGMVWRKTNPLQSRLEEVANLIRDTSKVG
jgi:LysR family hydrogen peroxide-inducible transcriptional activator